MNIFLIAGLWLDASVWDTVAHELDDLGHHAVPVTLPGQGAPPANATLADQRAAVLTAIDGAEGPGLVVGHSASSTLAWMAADARPQVVVRVVMVGGFPAGDGDPYFGTGFPVVDGAMPFPGWEPFAGPDCADLDEAGRESIAAAAIPVPVGVVSATVDLRDPRRLDIPVTVLCPEFSPAQAREWVDGGQAPELARARNVRYVDIDSGHWPMFTRPAELARLLAAEADG
jgi:pimeloyl-ACP methyl ester carboxylesterase